MRIGIIGPSDIAFRRFLPALQDIGGIEYAGVAYADEEEWSKVQRDGYEMPAVCEAVQAEARKAGQFQQAYGGKIFCGYRNLLESGEADAVYVPLPPALHFMWAKAALEHGLHVLVEKPSTISLHDTEELIRIADEKGLALHENYMFAFHSQLAEISNAVTRGEIGDVRMYRIDFGFPFRGNSDFRYQRELGGGALLDCGGYVLKYANMLLGGKAEVVQAQATYADSGEIDVEIFGSGVMMGEAGGTAQIAFGMDNDYRCSIDIWGSKGTISSNRILTAPAGFVPTYTVSKDGKTQIRQMEPDDAFCKSILHFMKCTKDGKERISNYKELVWQQHLVEEFSQLAGIVRHGRDDKG